MQREDRYERRGGGFDRGPREMHKISCSECGKEAEVPFKPDGTRPVYCRDCFQKHRPKRY
jgi:CxxC-x17-CxxC domain-containing protein